MSNAMRVARMALVVTGLAGSVFAPAASSKKGPVPQVNWWIGKFTYLKRVRAEPNAAPNDQPLNLSPDMVIQDLSAIRLNGDEPLFSKEEINDMVGPICGAMAQAKPSEDLILLSTSARTNALLAVRSAITARLFVKDGQLNLILHDARFAFFDRYLAMHTEPDFKFGSRTLPSAVELDCLGAGKVRPDWLTFPVILDVPKPAPVALAAGAALPAPVAAAQAPVAAAPAPAPAPQVRDQAFYEQQQQRLRALKRMHDDGLITDAEFNAKRKELIEGL